MDQTRRKLLVGSSLSLLGLTVSGCGTILHPERKGQVNGKIDPGIAALDGLGLLLFFIPGIIAFAVDFSNGTIYLPGTQTSATENDEIRQASFEGQLSEPKLDRIWLETYDAEKPFAAEDLQRQVIRDVRDVANLVRGHNSRAYASAGRAPTAP